MGDAAFCGVEPPAVAVGELQAGEREFEEVLAEQDDLRERRLSWVLGGIYGDEMLVAAKRAGDGVSRRRLQRSVRDVVGPPDARVELMLEGQQP